MRINSNLAFSIENNYNNSVEIKNSIFGGNFGIPKKQHMQIIKENILASSMDMEDIKAAFNLVK